MVPAALASARNGAFVGLVLALVVSLTACTPDTPESRVADTMRRVEEIRGLESGRDVPYRFLGSDSAFTDLLDELDQPETVAEMEAEAAVLERLGLLPRGLDTIELTRQSAKDSVLGYYDPESKLMTIVDEDGDISPDELMVLAHEYAHALQDTHHDLETRFAVLQDDERLAFQALVEGEATIVMYVWAIKRLSMLDWEELESIDDASIPSDYVPLQSVPPILSRPGEFPYIDGAAFVYDAWEPGGWAAIEGLWAAPPISTEQIMHPERYPNDRPVEVELPDLAGVLGPGWFTTTELTMGELQISVLLADGEDWDYGDDDETFVFPMSANAHAAEGWGGDRLAQLEGPGDAWAITWQTTWDTPQDALEFARWASLAMAEQPGTRRVRQGVDISSSALPHPVLVLITDGPDTYGQLTRGLDIR